MADYSVDSDRSRHIKSMMSNFYKKTYSENAAFWQQAMIDKRFKAGDQSLWSMMYSDNSYYSSRKLYFNLIRRHTNMICGFQRKNRKSTVMVPLEAADDQLAEDYTGCTLWSEKREGAHEYVSQAFEGAVDVGLAFLHLYPDYSNNSYIPDFRLDNVDFNSILIDPYWKKQDLSDCNGLWRRKWLSKDGVKILLPGLDDEIDSMQSTGNKDGKFPLQAELLSISTNNLLPYDEFYYRDFREGTFILDPFTMESVEWEDIPGSEDIEMEQVLAQQPWLKVQKKKVPTVKLCISVADKVVYDGPNLLGIDSYPFVPVVGYQETALQNYSWRFQGVVRGLRDAQFLYNRRKIIELQILESQINSGWIYPVDAITNEKAFRQTGQGMLVPLKKGHSPAEVQQIRAPEIPASMIELSRGLAEDITKISGVNEELLGSAEDDKAGILAMMRQGAGLTTLQGLFDRLDYSQRLLGTMRLEAMRKNWTKGKVERILNREVSPKFFSSDISKYDIAVEEGAYSTTQRQMEFRQLVYLRSELGMPISDEMIISKSMVTGKKDILEQMAQAQQAQQQQAAQQAQLEEQSMRSDQMAKYAKAKSDIASAEEKMASAAEKESRIQENESSAEHKEAMADMEVVKLLMELEDMDKESFRKSLEMMGTIQGQNTKNSLT